MQDTFQLPGQKQVIPALSIFLSSQNILYQLNSIWILVSPQNFLVMLLFICEMLQNKRFSPRLHTAW